MTINLKGISGRFTGEYTNQEIKINRKLQDLALNKIKSELVIKTFADIKKIVKNIGDHPNPELLIKKLEKSDDFEYIKDILANVIQNSSFQVEKILDI